MSGGKLTQRARERGNPVVDDGGLTWVWLEEHGPAPALIGDWCDWDHERAIEWERAANGARTAHLELPADAYMEYAFVRPDGSRVRDPLSRSRIGNGVGDWNHRAWMPEAPREALRLRHARRRAAPSGKLTEHRVEPLGLAVGKRRRIWLHHPAGHDPRDLPLLVVLDGNDYLRAKADRLLEHLVAAGRMRPVVTAFCEHAGLAARMVEYMGSEVTLAFMLDRVIPLVCRELGMPYPTVGRAPGTVTILGASAGGLMALHAGLRVPEVFGRVLAQSGGWEFGGRELAAVLLARHAPVAPLRIWMDAGRYEWLFDANERMWALLERRGYDVTYRRFNAGHNFTAWMEELMMGLPALLPPT